MKNKLKLILLLFFIFSNVSLANEFNFETSKIEILNDGNLVLANDGKAVSTDGQLEIQAMNFEYIKNLNLLKASQGIAYIKANNIKIEFNELEVDQKYSTLKASKKVKIVDTKKKINNRIRNNSI